MVKEIQLTKGYVTLVDDEDFDRLSGVSWYASVYNLKWVYAVGSKNKKFLRMHRVILEITNPKLKVDHINHDTLDNRKENLRITTNEQNLHNSQMRLNNKSGFKGVCYNVRQGKYQAAIGYKSKLNHLGYFHDPVDAAKAYDKAAIEMFGEYAHTNKMMGLY